jgi:serine/threonine-protein kinase
MMKPWQREIDDELGFLGQTLGGRYLIEAPLGTGAFAIVYRAQTESGRPVAIKISRTDDEGALFRFGREIKVMESLPESRQLVGYEGHGTTPDGRLYLAMEHVEGPTLSDWLRERPVLTPHEACACVGQVALALQNLHRFNIVHRDLKPSNVLLSVDGVVKLFDFGLVLDPDGMLQMFETQDLLGGRNLAVELERGFVVGTPEYMASEQFEDAKGSGMPSHTKPASDVFSAGVVLYRLITGRLPFPMSCQGERVTPLEIVDYLELRSKTGTRNLVRPPEADPQLWNIISRTLSTVAWMRPKNGKALADELFWYLTTRPEGDSAALAAMGSRDTEAPTHDDGGQLNSKELFGDLDLTGSWSWKMPLRFEE